jgi:hypothetical protein
VNRERSALSNNGGTLPPSNGEYFVGRESRGEKGEEYIPEYLGGSVESGSELPVGLLDEMILGSSGSWNLFQVVSDQFPKFRA